MKIVKEAYLIMAHNNWDMVRKLILAIDNVDNDIFLHINLLSDMPSKEYFEKDVLHSKIFYIERKPVYWGDYTFSKVIFMFFKDAISKEKGYQYFHILSGSDLLIKKAGELKSFLAINLYNNNSKRLKTNYITYHIPKDKIECFPVAEYNLFVKHWRNHNGVLRKTAKGTALLLNYMQSLIGINRMKSIGMQLYKGDSFFSVSDEFVRYALNYEGWAYEHFGKKTFGADEFVFQTIAMNSKFSESIYDKAGENSHPNLRHIDFARGTPYVWKMNDYDELKNTNDFFARKFDATIDGQIINTIYEDITK